MGERISRVHLVAIIGAGAAGLVFAKILVDNGLHVTVYEQKSEVGGVWNYEPGSSAMYASLRTNLPKEIMAISEEDSFPESDHSFLTHYEVQAYLKQYTDRHFLRQYIHFATEVTYVRKHGGDTGQARWRVETRRDDDVPSTACFDAVVVCNGHFHIPHTPPLPPGYREYFKGISYHSNQYDTVKSLLRGKNVLVVGSKSSGTDTARELLTIAHRVYVSDRNYASGLSDQSTVADAHVSSVFVHTGRSGERSVDAVPSTTLPTVLPAIDHVTSDGHFMFADQRVVTDIDVVLWCTGYLYDFPFLSSTSASLGAELTDGRCSEDPPETRDTSLRTTGLPAQELHPQATTTEFTAPVTVEDGKRVRPLYQQLFCINDPTLVFAGLPFRVVPFPLFRFQAEYAAAVFSGRAVLPNLAQRCAWLAQFEAKLTQTRYFGEKYHYLGDGDDQWEYCRILARESGLMEERPGAEDSGSAEDSESSRVGRYIRLMQEIYNDNIAHRPVCPGAPDTYRKRRYRVNWEDHTWSVS